MLRLQPLDPSLKTVVFAIAKHWRLSAACIAMGLLLAFVAYLLVSPVYEATASLVVGPGGQEERGDRNSRAETVATLARIAESDEVVRTAIERVGLSSLQFGDPEATGRSLGGQIRSLFQRAPDTKPIERISAIDVAVTQAGRLMSVRTDPNSEVIRISFRHQSPSLSAAFANALAAGFIERQISLLDRPGAVEFFKSQAQQFNEGVARSSRALDEFMQKENAYSIEEQRALLLKRRSELEGLSSSTRSSMAAKQGQKSALVAQLKLLKPVTQSPYVSQLVEALASESRPPAQARRPSRDEATDVPPLLMVKVYQDNMVDLFRYNSEIAGLESLSRAQQLEMDKVEGELNALTQRQAEFERLKRDVSLATYNADLFTKRTIEERINADLREAKLSNLRILQRASVPLQASSPRGSVFLIVGLVLGMLMALGASLALELFAPMLAGTKFAYARPPQPEASAGLRTGSLSPSDELRDVVVGGRASAAGPPRRFMAQVIARDAD